MTKAQLAGGFHRRRYVACCACNCGPDRDGGSRWGRRSNGDGPGAGACRTSRDALAVRGLLHDLGHEMTTLSYLVEAVRGDVDLPEDAGYRLELLSLEMSRLLDIIATGCAGT